MIRPNKFNLYMIHRFFFISTSVVFLCLFSACGTNHINESARKKIGFDLAAIDAAGLRNGTVSVDYEYCIPADDASLKKVQDIDPKVKLMKASKGRIGCTAAQWLCISNTHDPAWKEKIMAIAALDFVERIEETVWE